MLLSIPVFGQNVNLNPNFGSSGIAITPNTSEINEIAVDAQGSIISAGYTIESGGTGIYHLTLTKHTENGAIVSNFGANGIVTTTIDHSEFPLDIALQADGKILVAGSSYLGPTQSGPGDYQSFVVRYKTNGDLDSSFASNGIFKLPHSDSHIASMIVLTDGSILAAGNSFGTATISKISANGVLDSSFGNNGSVYLSDVNYTFILWEAKLLSDHTIMCVGYDGTDLNNSKLTYCKVDLNGDFVSNFGQNGKVVIDLHNSFPQVSEFLSGIKETVGGKVILVGYSTTSLMIKINLDGTMDTNFGTNGILNHSYPFSDFDIQEDGKFIIGGNSEVSEYNYGFTITRLTSEGSLDNSFNGTGSFTTDISTGNDYLQTVKLLGTNHILVAGSSRLSAPNAHFMLANIDISQSLKVESFNPEQISVYPNPTMNDVHFVFKQTISSPITLTVTDNLGRCLIRETRQSTGEIVLDLGSIQAGNYFVSLNANNTQHTYSVIKK